MKILYLHQYFATPADSTGTRSYEMAKRWVVAGHRVVVVTTERSDNSGFSGWRIEVNEGIEVHRLALPYSNTMGFGWRILAFVRFALSSARRAVGVGGDVVFATSTPLTILLPGLYAKWRMKCPLVFEVRDLWPKVPIAIGVLRNPLLKRLACWLERAGYKSSAAVVVLSPDMVDHVAANGCSRSRIVVAPNASDTELFGNVTNPGTALRQHFPMLKRSNTVLYAGTLGKINGVEYFADIAAAARDQGLDTDFLVIGDGMYREALERRAQWHGVLNDNFWLTPPIPKVKLAAVLGGVSLATSFVIDVPELWANSANKLFDAFAAGVPVMINYQGWQAELLSETGAGFSVPPNDAVAAATRIGEFLGQPGLRDAAAGAAEELAKTRFDRQLISMRVLAAIERAVAQHGAVVGVGEPGPGR